MKGGFASASSLRSSSMESGVETNDTQASGSSIRLPRKSVGSRTTVGPHSNGLPASVRPRPHPIASLNSLAASRRNSAPGPSTQVDTPSPSSGPRQRNVVIPPSAARRTSLAGKGLSSPSNGANRSGGLNLRPNELKTPPSKLRTSRNSLSESPPTSLLQSHNNCESPVISTAESVVGIAASEATHTPVTLLQDSKFTVDSPSLAPPPNDGLFNGNGPVSPVRSAWEPSTIFGEDDDLMTEVDATAPDEEFIQALRGVGAMHTRKLMKYKRLLEQTHSSTASQLHALQAEVKMLREGLGSKSSQPSDKTTAINGREADVSALKTSPYVPDMTAVIRGSMDGTISDSEVKSVLRSHKPAERMRLIHTVLDSCLPGDISAMMRLLERYLASRFDLLTELPQETASLILRQFEIPEMLAFASVSRSWHGLVHYSATWRYHCLRISATDSVPLRRPPTPDDWEPLYKILYRREQNWSRGVPQSIQFLNGHTGFVTSMVLRGNRLITGSHDETIRAWDLETCTAKMALKVKAVSCLDFFAEEEVFAAGYQDIGRVQIFSSITWELLQTLQGHLNGIRAVVMNSNYLVSAGADKALICWDWRAGTKLVRFGQQTNLNIGVQLVDNDWVISVTIDGLVRTFSIRGREMLSQFKLSDLQHGDPRISSRLLTVGAGAHNMLQWFSAKGDQITCATKSVILHLQWSREDKRRDTCTTAPLSDTSPSSPRAVLPSSPTVLSRRKSEKPSPASPAVRQSLARSTLGRSISTSRTDGVATSKFARQPRVVAMISTPDVSVGAVDPVRGRVITSTRFSSRSGADRRMFVSTYKQGYSDTAHGFGEFGSQKHPDEALNSPSSPGGISSVTTFSDVTPIRGVWEAEPDLATPELNPMAMVLSHDKACVGCADGTIYVLGFLGHEYTDN